MSGCIARIRRLLGHWDDELPPRVTLEQVLSVGIVRTLDELLGDRCALKTTTASSYLHGNGFFKLVLVATEPEGPKLRLHVWNSMKEGSPHDHSWSYSSMLLYGSYTMTVWQPAVAVTGSWRQTMVPNVKASTTEPILGRVPFELRKVREVRARPGEVLELAEEVVHTITVSEIPAATVVLQSGHRQGFSRVFTETPPIGAAFGPARRLSLEECMELIQEVRANCIARR